MHSTSPQSIHPRSRSPFRREDNRDARRASRSPRIKRRRAQSGERRSHESRRRSPKASNPRRAADLPSSSQPPVPNQAIPRSISKDNHQPPLPDEPTPADDLQRQEPGDDGWAPVWDQNAQAFYFYNRFTQATQWDNPRVPDQTSRPLDPPPGLDSSSSTVGRANGPNNEQDEELHPAVAGGYNPAIHGDYDPNADYAQPVNSEPSAEQQQPIQYAPGTEPTDEYAATASFNRFTGKFNNTNLHPTHTPVAHTDEAKSKRQMSAFFDVDAAANSHDGRSLKAERQGRKLSKKEVKEFKEKRGRKKEEKRRAWLRD